MKKRKNLTSVITVIGILLILSSALLFVYSYYSQQKYADEAEKTAKKILQLMPEKAEHYTAEKNQSMPVFEVDGVDYIGVIDIPGNKSSLPVAAYWDETSIKKYPCRYLGGLYEDIFMIGGNDSNGQFAMIKTLAIGQKIQLTNVSGEGFSYTVTSVEINRQMSNEAMERNNDDLILFVKNSFNNKYTLVKCDLK